MENVIDSKKQQLTLQDVMIRRVYEEHNSGRLKVDPAVALITLVKELELPRSEAILFGNTVFISHYTKDGSGALVRMLNVDTAKNLLNNCGKFAQHLRQQGTKNFVSQYDYKGYVQLFERMQKMKMGQVITKEMGNGQYISFVTMA